ncbi:putative methyltransferase-domain-containing protein [Cristinia sonorae]|uniref:Methyltransferase-domain-containing protein n=1 Tax=Cristinia sonorae TaxID=1940300 RepID=A0A8K0UUZ9_9AGAR|nr:putative methyltransferase-domain-containing protein [Cristinia sonorae]
MFYYLSFLRPPPQQWGSLSAPITITPQLANDLRTELLDGTCEIYYSWCQSNSICAAGLPNIPKARKLTTWREGSAYKEILVPLPQGLREGTSYSLVLTVHDQGFPHIINLAGPSCGVRPLPVISQPILFSSRSSGQSAGKQEQIRRIYRVPTAPGNQVYLRVTEQTSFDLDKKIWDSGIGLSCWLTDLATSSKSESGLQQLENRLLNSSSLNIIELGAGTGIVALTLGALLSAKRVSNHDGCIITTDLASAMPLLEHNIAQNAHLFTSPSMQPRAIVLDWDENIPPEVSAVKGGFDFIIMADVTYNTASFPMLVRTLKDLVGLRETEPPLIIMGYKERDPAERTLWEMARGVGIDFRRIGERVGAGGAPIEIWLGHIQAATK